MHWRYRGHQIGLGSHLVEDPGDSLTRVCELVGVELAHSERSDSMPFWDRDRLEADPGALRRRGQAGPEALHRGARRDAVRRSSTRWDHASLREWMSQHTSDEGVFLVWEAISMLEQITLEPWEHSA